MILVPFSFIATVDGQTTFGPVTPPVTPMAIVAKNGVLQNVLNQDFSINAGIYINVPQGILKGDIIAGNIFL